MNQAVKDGTLKKSLNVEKNKNKETKTANKKNNKEENSAKKEIDNENAELTESENKPKVGFEYRYRVALMKEAVADGTYVKPQEKEKKSDKKHPIVEHENEDENPDINLENKPKVNFDYRYRVAKYNQKLKDCKSAENEIKQHNEVQFDHDENSEPKPKVGKN
jgi:hypothetical protein